MQTCFLLILSAARARHDFRLRAKCLEQPSLLTLVVISKLMLPLIWQRPEGELLLVVVRRMMGYLMSSASLDFTSSPHYHTFSSPEEKKKSLTLFVDFKVFSRENQENMNNFTPEKLFLTPTWSTI